MASEQFTFSCCIKASISTTEKLLGMEPSLLRNLQWSMVRQGEANPLLLRAAG